MKKQYGWALPVSLAAFATAGVMVMAGCGGSGGPAQLPPVDTGPSLSAQFLALLPADQRTATYVGSSDRCFTCHPNRANPPAISRDRWLETQHAQLGIGCEQCHGPASKHVVAGGKTTILTYPNITRSLVCGQCHGPMYSDYTSSAHAGVVSDAVASGIGSAATGKTCYRCHVSTFRERTIELPLAAGQTADQVDAGILAIAAAEVTAYGTAAKETASCSTCHNPHANTGNLSLSGKEVYLRHPAYSEDTSRIAPGVPIKTYTTYAHACATCHNGRGANPSDSALQSGTARPNMHSSNQFNMLMGIGGVEAPGGPIARTTAHATAPGQCSHCHMSNGRHTFVASYDTGCLPCHTAADAAARAAIKGDIELRLITIRSRMEAWATAAYGDKDFWDYSTSIAQKNKTSPNQSSYPIEILRARHNYYFVLNDGSLGIHNSAYTRHLLDQAGTQLTAIGRAAEPAQNIPTSRAQIRAILRADRLRAARAEGGP